jgi:hypothetical protein
VEQNIMAKFGLSSTTNPKSVRMLYCMRHDAQTKRRIDDPWRPVTCYVAYGNARKHLDVVEQDFQWSLRFDLDYMHSNHPDHFHSPHNVARAILVFHYFRDHHLFFEQEHYSHITQKDLPQRPPDKEGEDFKLWADFPEGF